MQELIFPLTSPASSFTKIEDLIQGASEGGITVTYSGDHRSLMALGLLEETGKGYSAVMPMAYPTELKNPKAHLMHYSSPGIMTGEQPMMGFPAGTSFSPYAILRNTSNKPLVITPHLYYMEGMGMGMDTMSAPLPVITLLPLETRRLGIPAMLHDLHLDNMTSSINLTFEGQMTGGDLLIANGSVDNTGTYVFEVADQVESPGMRRGCYWEFENGSDTMLTLWNFGDKDEDLMVTFEFAGGSYRMPTHVGAKQFAMFNAGEIIGANLPDDKGHTFPTTGLRGTIMVENKDESHFIHQPSITLTPQTFNVKTATCGAGCSDCTGPYDYSAYSTFTAPFGTAIDLNAGGHDSGSHPVWRDYTTTSSWSSSDSSVATVGLHTGIVSSFKSGSFTFIGTSPVPANGDPCWWDGYEECDPGLPDGSGGGTITDNTPVITSVSDWYSDQTATPVTISGSYFGTNAPTLSFSPSTGITYSLVSYNDSTIVASITTAAGVPSETVNVTVPILGTRAIPSPPVGAQSHQTARKSPRPSTPRPSFSAHWLGLRKTGVPRFTLPSTPPL